jgi:polysaccharide pyruvyl transferase WcaK-like protein
VKFAITGVTISGNMGGAAMLAATLEQVSRRFPTATCSLLSITPDADRAVGRADVAVVDARPLLLVGLYMPLAILLWPVARFGVVRRQLLARIPFFKALIEADAVIDLCGIAFADGRGLPLLVYNVVCCLPAFAVGTRVFKLAQALGPFKTQPNRWLARFVLRRCAAVVARGETTLSHLAELGIKGAIMRPDTSFAMTVTDEHRAAAARLMPALAPGRRLLICSPSEVVRRLCLSKGIPFEDVLTEFLEKRLADAWNVVLVPHSLGRGTSKNNDVDLSRRILARLPAGEAGMIEPVEEPQVLRAVIGRADVFVGCRFHSVVAALAMGVPSLVIGWSHKYREMTDMLQPGDWTIDWSTFSVETAEARFLAMATDLEAIGDTIRHRLPGVCVMAEDNYALMERALQR